MESDCSDRRSEYDSGAYAFVSGIFELTQNDQADVFLEQRSLNELDRNAMVAVLWVL